MDWYPDADETPLFQGGASFASGRASKVVDRRWFRDDQGRDIGDELPGWPPAPVHQKRGPKADKAARAGRGLGMLAKATAFVAVGVVELLSPTGGSMVTVKGPDGSTPTDPALEIEDFPVLWAPAGTLARTVPWRLDPDRRPEHYRTDLQLTDRRIIVLGSAVLTEPADVLWQATLDQVARAQAHAFSAHGGDVTIAFADGSWIRLDLGSPGRAAKAAWVLNGHTELVKLNEAQQAWAVRFTERVKGTLEVLATPVPDAPPGTLSVELIVHRSTGQYVRVGTVVVDAEGKPVVS